MAVVTYLFPPATPPPSTNLEIAIALAQVVGWSWFREHPQPGAREVEGGFGDLLADLD